MSKVKIHTILRYLFISFLVATSLLSPKSNSQTIYPWDADPKAYVQNLAILASKDQIKAQDDIKSAEITNKELNIKLSQAKDLTSKDQIAKEIKSNKVQLSYLKSILKSKIRISKSYKSLLSQSTDQIKAHLIKESKSHLIQKDDPFHAGSTDTMTATILKTTDSTILFREKPPKSAIEKSTDTNESANISPPESPRQVVIKPTSTKESMHSSHTSSIYDQWVGSLNTIVRCKFQTFNDPAKYKGVESELLFTYTPEEIKSALKGISYSKGYAFIGKEPGYTFIQLNIEIASDLALQHYGNLNKSFMLIKLINGKVIRLINSRFDPGKSDRIKKMTFLSGIYYIDKEDEKALTSSPLDTIKLQYASGYEDYIIYNVDFFIRQFSCINSLK